jgi:MoxR-like ATPase
LDQGELKGIPARIMNEVGKYVQGREDLLQLLIATLLCGGHVLVEGLPGTAKTLMARSFAQAIGGQFKRVQLTPDMLPGDITGFNLHRPDRDSEFIPGPIFANIVLADELNRTTPRTQSAFLEAMGERQVTVEGITYPLPQPFMVVATQVPYEGEGTFQVPNVQADRFLFRIWSGYPEREVEARVLEQADILEEPYAEAVTTPQAVLELRNLVKRVYISDLVRNYILDLVEWLRSAPDVLEGPSPRASLALYRGCRALALLEGRDFALPDDIRRLAFPAFEHRIRITAEAELDEVTPHVLIERVLEAVPVPKGPLTP